MESHGRFMRPHNPIPPVNIAQDTPLPVLNVLILASSRAEADELAAEIDHPGFNYASDWAADESRYRDLMQSREWDAVVASAASAELAADLMDRAEPPLFVVVANQVDDEAVRQSLRHGACFARQGADRDRLWDLLDRRVRMLVRRQYLRKAQKFATAQTEILESIASGDPLAKCLESIVRLIEVQIKGSVCSILLLDREQRVIRHGASLNLPNEYVKVIDGSGVGPEEGSCGAAAFSGERVIVGDIATHPNWAKYREAALASDLKACWSSPIFSPFREVLGTFAVYYREIRRPTDEEMGWVDDATHLAAIAIMREHHSIALRQSESRYRQLLETTHQGVITIDLDGRITFANRRALDLMGVGSQEFWGRRIFEFVHPSELSRIEQMFERRRSGISDQYELRFRPPSGRDLWVIIDSSPIENDAGDIIGMLGMLTDITERKRYEEKIAEQAALLDHAHDAILLRTIDGIVRYWNQGATRLYGWSASEAIGKHVTELHYRTVAAFGEAQRRVLAEGEWNGEITQRDKQGRDIIVDASWTLVRDREGKPQSILAINTDITEKRRQQAQLALSQRMESLGTLAGGIAHDFNNILTAIMGNLEYVRMSLQPGHRAHAKAAIALAACSRAEELVKRILAFSRPHEPNRVSVRLQNVVEEVLVLLRSTLPAMIELRTVWGSNVPATLADASQIHQILMNLATNAAQAMGDQGTLTIRLEGVLLENTLTGAFSQVPPGRYARLTVEDTGSGMDQAIIARMFDPFFTTKGPGQGTGLGLYAVQSIIKDHGGAAVIDSEIGRGTKFHIYFPEEKNAVNDAAITAPEPTVGHKERILFIDDEPSILAIGSEMLSDYGYRVETFSNPSMALRMFESAPQEVDAVLTDYAMPGMSGLQLAEAILRIRPDLPILLISGHMRPEDEREALRLGVYAVLTKPSSAHEMLRVLEEIFSHSGAR